MFHFDPSPVFTHTVRVLVPIDNGHDEQTFDATFKVLPTDEFAVYDLSDGASSGEFVRKVLIGVADIQNSEGRDVPWSDRLRDQLIALPFVRAALARTYLEAVSKATLGN